MLLASPWWIPPGVPGPLWWGLSLAGAVSCVWLARWCWHHLTPDRPHAIAWAHGFVYTAILAVLLVANGGPLAWLLAAAGWGLVRLVSRPHLHGKRSRTSNGCRPAER